MKQVHIPPDLHHALKEAALSKKKKLGEFVTEKLAKSIKFQPKPNAAKP